MNSEIKPIIFYARVFLAAAWSLRKHLVAFLYVYFAFLSLISLIHPRTADGFSNTREFSLFIAALDQSSELRYCLSDLCFIVRMAEKYLAL